MRTLFGRPSAGRASPANQQTKPDAPALSPQDAQLSSALMRVNHVGEICAQALYQSQSLVCRDPKLRRHFEQAARDELDHLAWTQQRLDDLGGRRSYLTPLWYGGAFGIGCLAGLAGDRISLGFVVETERQVEQHLASHMERLPAEDHASRAVVAQMKEEEARHADEALAAGAQLLPAPIKSAMRLSAKVMTRTAHYI
ncbi:ubiquinone biosynthesis monooxygenase Coq7 [Paucibacter oligotrophus]|uniref:3-demethoxyubiquinol 3-hydroxylase n=1 Tax=Roseateles oligotrophus TaxID=1769250 RepID=A0A840L999_9BURK|nr:ubiquinone biosynthesis monooxygenase Coq7 [Roseateles oligotrophus]